MYEGEAEDSSFASANKTTITNEDGKHVPLVTQLKQKYPDQRNQFVTLRLPMQNGETQKSTLDLDEVKALKEHYGPLSDKAILKGNCPLKAVVLQEKDQSNTQ
jgi:hypothetical protein